MELSEELFLWRPIMESLVTYTEVCTILSLNDMLKAHALLDMKNDLEQAAHKKRNSKK